MTTTKETEYSFAERLDYLFHHITHPDGREYSYEEVQNGTGKAVTSAYIWRLRTGKATNPGFWVLKALSEFFDVEPSYFFRSEEESKKIVERHKLATELENSSVKVIAMRASELDEQGRQAILGMMEYILQKKTD